MRGRCSVVDKEINCIRVLHFQLQDIRCCLELHYVEKVLPLSLLETIPGSPIYLVGLMNLQNRCIPIIDLGIRAGLVRDQNYPLNIPILLCSDETHRIGFIVDRMIGLSEINKEKIEIHEEFAQSHSPFYGAITLNTGVSLLMNATWLFALNLTQETQRFSVDHD